MPDFDPYLQWLGIRDPQRPPNHYRLLGLELFESNESVIANAADRQMAHVRTFQTGAHADLSQQVLNELAAARVCLLKADKKAAYDQQLRAQIAASRPAPAVPKPAPVAAAAAAKPAAARRPVAQAAPSAQPAPVAVASPYADFVTDATSMRSHKRRKRKQQKSLAPYALVGVILLAIALFGLVAMRSQPQQVASNPPTRSTQPGTSTPAPTTTAPTPKENPKETSSPPKPTPSEKENQPAPPDETDKPATPTPVIVDVTPPEKEAAAKDDGTTDLPPVSVEGEPEATPSETPETENETADDDAKPVEKPEVEPLPHVGPKPLDSNLAAIPSEDDRKAALDRIREIFGEELDKSRSPEEKQKLANTLLEQATTLTQELPEQFALLELVRQQAVAAGDIDLAHRAIELQSERFAVDPLPLEYDAIVEINRHARTAEARAALIPIASQLVDLAIERDDFAQALKYNDFLQQAAKRARERDAMKATLEREKSIREMQKQQESALAALKKVKADANDPQANLELGAYLCFVKQDWDNGLLRLSKSSVPLLQDAALQELAKPTEAAKQKQLADLWLKCADEKTLAQWSDGMKSRAREHYEASLDQLAGLDKAEVEKRLKELTAAANDQPRSSGASQLTIKLPGGIPMTFRRIPAGKFIMGSPPNEPGRRNDEAQHLVAISKPFYFGVTEVTQAQWMAVMQGNPSAHRGDPALPVENVSWDDAIDFCRRASGRIGGQFRLRLPTEAEWEYACRAGTTTSRFFGNTDDPLPQFAWFHANSGGATHPVGLLKPNPWGLFDVYGNVNEWCSDYQAPYELAPQRDPTGPTSGNARSGRGYDFRSPAQKVRSAARPQNNTPSVGHPAYGLRPVLEVR